MFPISANWYWAITTGWTAISAFALVSSIIQFFAFLHYKPEGSPGALQVFQFLAGFFTLGSANRIITSFWFFILGILILCQGIDPKRISFVSTAFIAGIVVINGLILYSNKRSYNRYMEMRLKLVGTYSRDVASGIVESLEKLGKHDASV